MLPTPYCLLSSLESFHDLVETRSARTFEENEISMFRRLADRLFHLPMITGYYGPFLRETSLHRPLDHGVRMIAQGRKKVGFEFRHHGACFAVSLHRIGAEFIHLAQTDDNPTVSCQGFNGFHGRPEGKGIGIVRIIHEGNAPGEGVIMNRPGIPAKLLRPSATSFSEVSRQRAMAADARALNTFWNPVTFSLTGKEPLP
jgi:hypothetical protein